MKLSDDVRDETHRRAPGNREAHLIAAHVIDKSDGQLSVQNV
jgi:hypothetical protein